MRNCAESGLGAVRLGAGVLGMALALAAGCASSPTSRSTSADADHSGAGPAAAEVRQRSRGDYPEIETDEWGFTITEKLRVSGEARTDYQRALESLEQGRYEQGIALLKSVIETAPELTAPYIDLGIAYARARDFEAAEMAFLDALELTPDHPIAHNELGILYRKTGRFDAARASYERALTIHPAFHYARRNLAVLCDLYLADLACALEHYEAYLEAVTEDAEVAIWVADIRARVAP